jgi:anti-anti-sigma factor
MQTLLGCAPPGADRTIVPHDPAPGTRNSEPGIATRYDRSVADEKTEAVKELARRADLSERESASNPHGNQGRTMIIQRTSQGQQIHLKLSGPIDNAAAPEFSTTLAALTRQDCQLATLDLSDVPRICSAAIGTLLLFFRSQARLGREAQIDGIHQNLRDLFQTIRVDDVLHLRDR